MHVSRCFLLQMTNYWLKSQNGNLFWTSEVEVAWFQNCFIQWWPKPALSFCSAILGILVNTQANDLALTQLQHYQSNPDTTTTEGLTVGSCYLFFIYLFIVSGCVGSLLLLHCFSLVAVSGGYSSLWCAGFSLRWPLSLRSTGSRHAGFSSCGSWAQ